MIFSLFRIKNADTETGWNVRIPKSVWIVSAEIRYLLLEQKKFQNKSKNIDEVYQSVFFRLLWSSVTKTLDHNNHNSCIMFLSYRITFFHNVLGKLIIHQKVLYDIFYFRKSCKVVNYY